MKLHYKKLTPLFLLFTLFTTMLHISLVYVLIITIVAMALTAITTQHDIRLRNNINKNKKLAIVSMTILALFYLTQVAVLGLNISDASYALCILCAIFVFVIIQFFLIEPLGVRYAFTKAVCWFNIIFSSYYLLKVLLNGLPENRDSVLGYVSSNYCAAILYLSFPLLLYTIFTIDKTNIDNRNMVKQIYVSIILSLTVILLSGSRTALGALLLIGMSIVLYRQKARKKIRTIIIVAVGISFVVILYQRFPVFQSLLNRALDALQGKKSVDNDVRTIAWGYAMANFSSYNQLLGSGSNMVPQLSRPAHNFFIETLLSTGYLGIMMLITTTGITIINNIKRINYEKGFFIFQLLALVLIVAYVQPFFTTAFTCGLITWGSFFSIMLEE